MYKINNDPGIGPATDVLWLTGYDPETGLVTGTSASEDEAMTFETDAARDIAIQLINSNTANTFIGHVPRPH